MQSRNYAAADLGSKISSHHLFLNHPDQTTKPPFNVFVVAQFNFHRFGTAEFSISIAQSGVVKIKVARAAFLLVEVAGQILLYEAVE